MSIFEVDGIIYDSLRRYETLVPREMFEILGGGCEDGGWSMRQGYKPCEHCWLSIGFIDDHDYNDSDCMKVLADA